MYNRRIKVENTAIIFIKERIKNGKNKIKIAEFWYSKINKVEGNLFEFDKVSVERNLCGLLSDSDSEAAAYLYFNEIWRQSTNEDWI